MQVHYGDTCFMELPSSERDKPSRLLNIALMTYPVLVIFFPVFADAFSNRQPFRWLSITKSQLPFWVLEILLVVAAILLMVSKSRRVKEAAASVWIGTVLGWIALAIMATTVGISKDTGIGR